MSHIADAKLAAFALRIARDELMPDQWRGADVASEDRNAAAGLMTGCRGPSATAQGLRRPVEVELYSNVRVWWHFWCRFVILLSLQRFSAPPVEKKTGIKVADESRVPPIQNGKLLAKSQVLKQQVAAKAKITNKMAN